MPLMFLGPLLAKVWQRLWKCQYGLWKTISKVYGLSSIPFAIQETIFWLEKVHFVVNFKRSRRFFEWLWCCYQNLCVIPSLDSNSMKELSPHINSVMNILESHASYLMSGKELSKLVAFVKGTQFDPGRWAGQDATFFLNNLEAKNL